MPVPSPFHACTAPLCESHQWKEWAGFLAVCRYGTSAEPEYHALRSAAGLLDVSPLFKYEVVGADAGDFLSYIATRDIAHLKPGRVTYSCMCDEAGMVIDDGTIARLDENRFRLTSASPMFRWLDRHTRGFDATVTDVSESLAALAIQGPQSRHIIVNALGDDLEHLPYFGVTSTQIEGVDVSRTGYTGDLGYEIWLPAAAAVDIWNALIAAGEPLGLSPCGLDALDITRIEAGFVLQGVDYFSAPQCAVESRKSTPFELGLGWTVELDRGSFLGQQALAAAKARGNSWNLVGLDVDWEDLEQLYAEYELPPALPADACRQALPIYFGQRQVGQATSTTWSPILKKYLALASVQPEFSSLETMIKIEHTVEFERRAVSATVVERPFFDPERKKA